MNKKFVKMGLIIVACLIGAAAVYYGYFRGKTDTAADSTEVVMEVAKGNITSSATGTGTIASQQRKEIMTLDKGIVENIYVTEGQYVNEGDLILTFENESGSSQYQNAELSLQIKERELNELNKDLAGLNVYAESSGLVGEINGEVGGKVSEGSSLTTITDEKTREIKVLFNGAQFAKIKAGDQAEILLPDSFARLTGTVVKVNSSPTLSDQGVKAYEVTVSVENPGGLATGALAQVTVVNSSGSIVAPNIGVVSQKKPVNVTLTTSGTIKKLNVEAGDQVKQGQLIAVLESPDLLNNIETQKLQVEQSRLSLNELQSTIENMVVYAPISGVITSLDVTKGERVVENGTVAVVSDLNNLEVVVPVDEMDIVKMKVGLEAKIIPAALSDKEYSAVVTKIAQEGTETNGVSTFDVTLSLIEIEGIKPGMSANTEIMFENKEDVITIPVEALQERGNNKFVMVRKDGQDALVPIKIGLVTSDRVEVTEGLAVGDQVVYSITGSSQSSNMPNGMFDMPGAGGGASSRSMRRD